MPLVNSKKHFIIKNKNKNNSSHHKVKKKLIFNKERHANADMTSANAIFYQMLQQGFNGLREINFSNLLTFFIFMYNVLPAGGIPYLISLVNNETDPNHVDYRFDTGSTSDINFDKDINDLLSGACSDPNSTYVTKEAPINYNIIVELYNYFTRTLAMIISRGDGEYVNEAFESCMKQKLQSTIDSHANAEQQATFFAKIAIVGFVASLCILLAIGITLFNYLEKKHNQSSAESKETGTNGKQEEEEEDKNIREPLIPPSTSPKTGKACFNSIFTKLANCLKKSESDIELTTNNKEAEKVYERLP